VSGTLVRASSYRAVHFQSVTTNSSGASTGDLEERFPRMCLKSYGILIKSVVRDKRKLDYVDKLIIALPY
jgi:hypothetical protein